MEEEVDPENAVAIRDLINHQAAEDIGELQQHRQVYSLRMLLTKFAPDGFRLRDATQDELKELLANMNRSDYAENSKHKFRCTIKKFYKIENGGHEHPRKVKFISTNKKNETTWGREDIFTEDELQALFRNFLLTRDRAFTMMLYESAARPGALLSRNIGDFTANGKGDFIFCYENSSAPSS
jgi:integrase